MGPLKVKDDTPQSISVIPNVPQTPISIAQPAQQTISLAPPPTATLKPIPTPPSDISVAPLPQQNLSIAPAQAPSSISIPKAPPQPAQPKQQTPQLAPKKGSIWNDVVHYVGKAVVNTANLPSSLLLGAARSAIGTAQGVSGLVDLVSPGTGTSQFSKDLDTAAKTVDTVDKQMNGNDIPYKIAQGVSDVGTFLAGGEIVKGVTELPKVANAIGKVGNVTSKVGNVISKVPGVSDATSVISDYAGQAANDIRNFADENGLQRSLVNAAKAIVSPKGITINAGYTALNTGQQASKDIKITPEQVATNLAINAGFEGGSIITKDLLQTFYKAAQRYVPNLLQSIKDKSLQILATTNSKIRQLTIQLSDAIEAHKEFMASNYDNLHPDVQNNLVQIHAISDELDKEIALNNHDENVKQNASQPNKPADIININNDTKPTPETTQEAKGYADVNNIPPKDAHDELYNTRQNPNVEIQNNVKPFITNKINGWKESFKNWTNIDRAKKDGTYDSKVAGDNRTEVLHNHYQQLKVERARMIKSGMKENSTDMVRNMNSINTTLDALDRRLGKTEGVNETNYVVPETGKSDAPFVETPNPLNVEDNNERFDVNNLPVDKQEDVTQEFKRESDANKLFSPQTRLSKMTGAGREFIQRFLNKDIMSSRLYTKMKDSIPTFYSLSKDEQKLAWLVKEGKATTSDVSVFQAVQELRNAMSRIYNEAIDAGITMGNYGTTYMPHDYSEFLNKKSNFERSVQYLVKTGQATSREDAVRILNEMRNNTTLSPNRFGNFEKSRTVKLPGYKIDIDTLEKYFKGASDRIAEARQFGANNEEVYRIQNRLSKAGHDVQAFNEIVDGLNKNQESGSRALNKLSTGFMKITGFLQLQKAFIAHLPQGFANIGSRAGFGKYFKAVVNQVFNKEERDWAHHAGVDGEDGHNVNSIRGTAMFLKQVRQFHRITAFIAGRADAIALAADGSEASIQRLRDLGVSGDLESNGKGGYRLSDDQQIQAAHGLSNSTIFSTSKIQSPLWLNTNWGKLIGQYRGAYTLKQSNFIIQLVKDARNGNAAPLIKYLSTVPLTGATVFAIKQLYQGKNPVTTAKKSPGNAIDSMVSDSGVGSFGAGIPQDIFNDVKYNYNNASLTQNIVGNVSATAGTLVQTGQNVDNALRGNVNPILKQVSGYLPLGDTILNSSIGKSLGYTPPATLTPVQQQFITAWSNGRQQLSKDLSPPFSQSANPEAIKELQKTRDIANTFLDNDHTSDGKTILLNSFQKGERYGQLASDPKALAAVQKFEQSLPNHNTIWDLSTDILKMYMQYEALAPGDPNRTVLEQKNPDLITIFANESAWEKTQDMGNNTVKGPGYVASPTLSNDQSQKLSQITALSSNQNRTPVQNAQLTTLENDSSVQEAHGLLDAYTNAERVNWGLQPIPYPIQSLTPEQNAMLKYEGSLPSGTGAKSAFIKANQDAWNQIRNVLAQETIYNVEKYGGVIQQGGKEPNFLKDVYNAGQYDIAKNADGSYAINPEAAYAANAGTSKPRLIKPIVYRAKKAKSIKVRLKKAPKSRPVRLAKQRSIKIKG